jgi:gas vesicle protein
MKIIPTEERKLKNEMLPQIMDKIFAICKHDPSFKSKDKLQAVEDVSAKLNEKIDRQKKLLQRGDIMIKDVKSRIETLDESNEKLRTDLLSLIGGSL